MITNKQIADAIFPNITLTIEDLEKKYPLRNLVAGAEVTRFAPSPTGFLHTGSLFTSMICRKVATQSNGVFFIRLEDTDMKREIAGSGERLIEQLKIFDVVPDEGYFGDYEEGNYGPYIQSKRSEIYHTVIKYLLEIGLAYPCFCTPEEVEAIREEQEKLKVNPGYYGQFAKYRNISNEERYQRIINGERYVVRFRSEGNHENKIKVTDLIRGEFEIAENDQDIVICKSDGLPTYHFAHVVDDHFMRTTTVIRGEEWVASLPIHVQIFDAIGWNKPNYAHLPVIMKLDENTGNKRKLSKRLDSEAAVSYFIEDGYYPKALIMYLMTIANSNFEEWILKNNFEHMEDFIFNLNKMSLDGALFDMGKLNFFARELFAKLNKDEITLFAKHYADKYAPELAKRINYNPHYFAEIMNIDREKINPRKDYEKFGNVLDIIGYFYQDLYEAEVAKGLPFNDRFTKEDLIEALVAIKNNLSCEQDEQAWFNSLKEIGAKLNYATNTKEYKANPAAYKGNIGDLAEILRITLTARKNAPNLYSVMKVLGKDESDRRINHVCSLLVK
ncbi:MAG: glutamate--tRNA ligase [Erysipelotrichaceae bacterium]|jgi:glutamyl-tRNA synthetase|nr:glutamate--tRNA ligase [Erysipelotrichaceae bacterium]